MRWNPNSPGQHQYASDILWADKIAKYMQAYYDQFGIKKMMYVRTSMPPKLNG